MRRLDIEWEIKEFCLPVTLLKGEKSAWLIPKSWQSGMLSSGAGSNFFSASHNLGTCHNFIKPVESPVIIIFESREMHTTEIVSWCSCIDLHHGKNNQNIFFIYLVHQQNFLSYFNSVFLVRSKIQAEPSSAADKR